MIALEVPASCERQNHPPTEVVQAHTKTRTGTPCPASILGLASGVTADEPEKIVTKLFLFLAVTILAVAWMMIRAAMEDDDKNRGEQ